MATGFALLWDSAGQTSATYDEVAYMRIAARWFRTGEQSEITRMGSPLSFWKLQQAPALWWLDRTGRGAWVDDPIAHQSRLLPVLRRGASWIWLAAIAITALWARQLYGNAAMALSAWLFALGPNLLAHGALITMELPITACWVAACASFWNYRKSGRRRWLLCSAAAAGLGFSCKFTAALLPPLLAASWLAQAARERTIKAATARQIIVNMIIFILIMIVADLLVTGFALLPASARAGAHPSVERLAGGLGARLVEVPIPQDWVGFLVQLRHQRTGGWSYLLGERRHQGWWYYYLVALAVKAPIGIFLLAAGRLVQALGAGRRGRKHNDIMLWLIPLLFVVIASVGSGRNYGVRYVLPVAPLFIIWLSGVMTGPIWARALAWLVLAATYASTFLVHPHELTYFNEFVGGTPGGRTILADSNLDWGQGLRALARLQQRRPELQDLTLYYFGDTDPAYYGVAARAYVIDAGEVHPGLPPALECDTAFLGVSSSLRWGPWGPPDYFRSLDLRLPETFTDDGTIAIYRNPFSDLPHGARRR